MPDRRYSILQHESGLRVVHLRIPGSRLVHAGFMIDTGSCHDGEHPGLAHALEHMMFKGTHRRKAFHVISSLEVVGGELNAYTTKDMTAVYASTESRHLQKAVDVLSDIVFNSSLPENELIKEKKVITDEINMYLDSPEENIYDEFQEKVFGSHPLAHNILGTRESVERISNQDLKDFVGQHYHIENMVFSVVGNVSEARVLQALDKYLQRYPLRKGRFQPKPVLPFTDYKPFQERQESDFMQAYAIIGSPAYGETHPNRYPLLLLNNLLGGPGMNSRLNLAIREKHGYTYHVESGYQSFKEEGLFHCYFSCELKYLEKSLALMFKEWKRLQEEPMGARQLSQAKSQYIGQMVMSNENGNALMLHLGKGVLRHGTATTLQQAIERIKAVQAEDIMAVAQELLQPERQSQLLYIPN
jgi:predicted Zn-dependent peptidase